VREGSYMAIEPGMDVESPGGHVGTVHEVLADEGSGIFVGLAISGSTRGRLLLVHGEHVDAVVGRTVTITAEADSLEEYHSPAERLAETRAGQV
jgi:hypothetical protein